ncbi:hypothetical protein BJ508DRAFT_417119, partial [Ascobolus immersus RN42]
MSFLTLPPELHLLIFEYLSPLDILKLSTLNHTFHTFFYPTFCASLHHLLTTPPTLSSQDTINRFFFAPPSTIASIIARWNWEPTLPTSTDDIRTLYTNYGRLFNWLHLGEPKHLPIPASEWPAKVNAENKRLLCYLAALSIHGEAPFVALLNTPKATKSLASSIFRNRGYVFFARIMTDRFAFDPFRWECRVLSEEEREAHHPRGTLCETAARRAVMNNFGHEFRRLTGLGNGFATVVMRQGSYELGVVVEGLVRYILQYRGGFEVVDREGEGGEGEAREEVVEAVVWGIGVVVDSWVARTSIGEEARRAWEEKVRPWREGTLWGAGMMVKELQSLGMSFCQGGWGEVTPELEEVIMRATKWILGRLQIAEVVVESEVLRELEEMGFGNGLQNGMMVGELVARIVVYHFKEATGFGVTYPDRESEFRLKLRRCMYKLLS